MSRRLIFVDVSESRRSSGEYVSEPSSLHVPVLVEAVLRLLDPRPGQVIFDGTLGSGGHAEAIAKRIGPGGRYIGVDIDEQMLAGARARLTGVHSVVFDLLHASYVEMPDVLNRLGISRVDAMLLDLGANSLQFDDAARGFSFDRDGPLDMRFDRRQKEQALDLVNRLSENELADLFYELGQEGASRKIAKKICQVRHAARITTTRVLAAAVESVFSSGHARAVGKIHPATRVFQALRVAVNRELDNLEAFLGRAREHLNIGGRLAVISFHSLEDGLVKRFLRTGRTAGTWNELTREPEVADQTERRCNPRSRSAKLRVAQRVESAREP